MTSAQRLATPIRKRVCSRQSASAAVTVVVATTEIGKSRSLWMAPRRSSPSTGLVTRSVAWLPVIAIELNRGPCRKFLPIIRPACG